LGLYEEIFSQGFPNYRIAFWNPGKPGEPRLVRTAVADDVTVPSRYPHKILLAAGRVVNILEKQMNKYGNEVERGLEFVSFEIVGGEFPVKVALRDVVTGRNFSVFTKHLVGADGFVGDFLISMSKLLTSARMFSELIQKSENR
jgi:2-polyprenyl-6-methoxyphenol hydroxylase-like FAD-dependent oxidoreductase